MRESFGSIMINSSISDTVVDFWLGHFIEEMAGLEGLSSHHPKETNRLYNDKEKWKIWMEVILKTCTHPAVVGSSEHFLLVGKKTC